MITALIFAISGYALLSVVSILDKYILTESVKKPIIYTFYSTFFFGAAFLFLPWSDFLSWPDMVWAVISGLSFGFAMWAMFVGLKSGETSHIAPFIGGVVALSTYALSTVLLGEILSSSAQIGFMFLVVACFLLSFENSKSHRGFHRGFLWAIIAGILFALSHVCAKYIYDLYPFVTSLVWTKGTTAFVGLLTLFWPGVLKQIIHPSSSPIDEHISKGKAFIIVIDKVLGLLGALAIQYAIAIGSVTIVNGMAGLQYVLMFIMIFLLTKIWPKIFSEYFTHSEIYIQISALLLIVIGFTFLQ